jgi:hypothetical protein
LALELGPPILEWVKCIPGRKTLAYCTKYRFQHVKEIIVNKPENCHIRHEENRTGTINEREEENLE